MYKTTLGVVLLVLFFLIFFLSHTHSLSPSQPTTQATLQPHTNTLPLHWFRSFETSRGNTNRATAATRAAWTAKDVKEVKRADSNREKPPNGRLRGRLSPHKPEFWRPRAGSGGVLHGAPRALLEELRRSASFSACAFGGARNAPHQVKSDLTLSVFVHLHLSPQLAPLIKLIN